MKRCDARRESGERCEWQRSLLYGTTSAPMPDFGRTLSLVIPGRAKARTSDVLLHIFGLVRSLSSGGAKAPTRWDHPGMTFAPNKKGPLPRASLVAVTIY